MLTVRFGAGFVGHRDGGAEVDPVVVLPGVVHHDRAVEALGEESDAAIDLTQLPLAVDVVAVLRAIAVARRPRDGLDELRSVDVPEARELVVQPLAPRRRDVVREAGRHGGVVGEIVLVVVAFGFLRERLAQNPDHVPERRSAQGNPTAQLPRAS
jgi:hypothetical protein